MEPRDSRPARGRAPTTAISWRPEAGRSVTGAAALSAAELDLNIRRFIALRADLLGMSGDSAGSSIDVAEDIERLVARMQVLVRETG